MPIALEVTLILFLVALSVGLLPLFFQMRRTGQGLEAFLLATRKDLAQIAEDVHASRIRMDHLGISLQASLDEVLSFAQTMGEIGAMVKNFHNRFHNSIESASMNLGGIIGGISALLTYFKRKPTSTEPEIGQPS